MAKPFLKWAGGKRQLAEELITSLHPDFSKGSFRNYAEPFVGGGALMFELFEQNFIDKAIICDFNEELILVYKTIKAYAEELIVELKKLQTLYDGKNKSERREFYFEQRSNFRNRKSKINFSKQSKKWIDRAKWFIFFNKTGFNGLYRVNLKGEFNVPPSDMGNKDLVQEANLLEVQKVLQNVTILSGDYQQCFDYLSEDWFVYFDPPYRPLKPTSFTTYSSHNWNDDSEQIRLAIFCQKIRDDKKVQLMVSNSDPNPDSDSLVPPDNFFEEWYPTSKGFVITPISAIRAINSNGKDRGPISELLIQSYPN